MTAKLHRSDLFLDQYWFKKNPQFLLWALLWGGRCGSTQNWGRDGLGRWDTKHCQKHQQHSVSLLLQRKHDFTEQFYNLLLLTCVLFHKAPPLLAWSAPVFSCCPSGHTNLLLMPKPSWDLFLSSFSSSAIIILIRYSSIFAGVSFLISWILVVSWKKYKDKINCLSFLPLIQFSYVVKYICCTSLKHRDGLRHRKDKKIKMHGFDL